MSRACWNLHFESVARYFLTSTTTWQNALPTLSPVSNYTLDVSVMKVVSYHIALSTFFACKVKYKTRGKNFLYANVFLTFDSELLHSRQRNNCLPSEVNNYFTERRKRVSHAGRSPQLWKHLYCLCIIDEVFTLWIIFVYSQYVCGSLFYVKCNKFKIHHVIWVIGSVASRLQCFCYTK